MNSWGYGGRTYTVPLVGESSYQAAVKRCRPGDVIQLMPEPTNRHDKKAIVARTTSGRVIGYIARDSWLQRIIHDEGKAVAARVEKVIGGGWGKNYGIILEVEPERHVRTKKAAQPAGPLTTAEPVAEDRPAPLPESAPTEPAEDTWDWLKIALVGAAVLIVLDYIIF